MSALAKPLRLIVGLGNIGAEYAHTRHNAGFWFVDAVARQTGVSLMHERKFHGALARFKKGAQEVWLLEPSTYMNRSGQAVLAVAQYYKISPDQILVVHDELDLPPGALRLKCGGGTGGHNGLKDIHARLATSDFWRLRIGIGHPRSLKLTQEVADFVLHPPSRAHLELIESAIDQALDVLPALIDGHAQAAMHKLHTS